MEMEGLYSLANVRDLAVTGFWEVAKRYDYFRTLLNRCVSAVQKYRPVAFIPVDYPGFNIRLAARIRSKRLPVIWYIAPQLWAWGEHRAKKLSAVVDRLLVVFPFEVEYFGGRGIRAEYVGHPLVEERDFNIEHARVSNRLLLMPGSRRQEIIRHVPLLKKTLDELQKSTPDIQPVVAQALNVPSELLLPLIDAGCIVTTDTAGELATASAGLIKAGTSTLEAALSGLPFATFYKTSELSYRLSKALVRVPSVTMMNLLLKRNVVHEYLQHSATPSALASEVSSLLSNSDRRTELTEAMREVRQMLAGGGASSRAAEIVCEVVKR